MRREIIEGPKGLGKKLGEINVLGSGGTYHKYAGLMRNSGTNKYNVLIVDKLGLEDIDGFPFIKEGTYIFPEMVSEEQARKKYDELK